MRSGKLLAEAGPGQLLVKFQCQSLEEVFLNLSMQQEEQKKKGITETVHEYFPNSVASLDVDLQDNATTIMRCDNKKSTRPRRAKTKTYQALLSKNFFQFIRHPGFVNSKLIKYS